MPSVLSPARTSPETVITARQGQSEETDASDKSVCLGPLLNTASKLSCASGNLRDRQENVSGYAKAPLRRL